MRSAEPAISVGLTFTRVPFSSRYTLKPRLCFSPPVCQLRTVPEPARCAVNDRHAMLVGKVTMVLTVFDVTGSTNAGTPVSVNVPLFVTVAGAPVVTVMVTVDVAPIGNAE